MTHSVSNNQLEVCRRDSGKREEEKTLLFITQTWTWPTNWKQPGSDFTRQKVVCLFLTQFGLYCWTVCCAACTWWWWYNGVAGKRSGAGSACEERCGETDMRAPREQDGKIESWREIKWEKLKEGLARYKEKGGRIPKNNKRRDDALVHEGVRDIAWENSWRKWCRGENCWRSVSNLSVYWPDNLL